MAVYISRKSSFLRLLVSFLPSVAIAALLSFLFSGPLLGPFYDFLLRRRPAPEISRELLIIDSSIPGRDLGDDILEPGAAASMLYTLAEFGANTLVIQVPILGLSAGGAAAEAEILYRFDEEFSLLSSNIRNLFDAIRTGSVEPAEAARYVGELVDLSDKGKERLVSALVRRDEEGILKMEQAAAFFGNARRPGDLLVQLIMTGEGGIPEGSPGALVVKDEYSRASPDKDGVLRRVAPILSVPGLLEGEAGERNLEHIVYAALKSRFETAVVDLGAGTGSKEAPVMVVRNRSDDTERIIPLDRNGKILFDVPHGGADFRRIGILDFFAYDEADKEMRRLLGEAESLGLYHDIDGENRPGFLYDYALLLKDEYTPGTDDSLSGEERKMPWIEARNLYFKSLESFLYGPAEMILVDGYERILESESLGESEIFKMIEMRDTLIQKFVELREKYNELNKLRYELGSELAFSFCILGRCSGEGKFFRNQADYRLAAMPDFLPSQDSMGNFFKNFSGTIKGGIEAAFYYENPTDAEVSALLANSILTGRVIKPGEEIILFICSLLGCFFICFFTKSMSPGSTLGTAALITVFVVMAFSLSFIFSGIWLPPLVPAVSAVTAALVSFMWAVISRLSYSRQFNLAFSPFVSNACLKSIINAGKPLPSQKIVVRAAVVAVRNSDLSQPWDSLGSYSKAVLVFHEKAADYFRKAGGTITGAEGDIVTACFGSPLERVFLGGKRKVSPYEDNINALSAPALRAAEVVSEIAGLPQCASWNFGLDTGKCCFFWTPVSGYTAMGKPVQKAKLLSRLTTRYKTKIIVSSSVNDALPDLAAKKLDVLKDKYSPEGEPFYRMSVRE